MVYVSAWVLMPYCTFYVKANSDPAVVSVLLSGVPVCELRCMEKCAQSSCIVGAYGETHTSYTWSAPQPPPPPHSVAILAQGSTRLLSFCGALFVEPLVGDIITDVAHAASAAKRRRERRLRAMLRHERKSVAMALAEFTHHSSRG